MNKSRERNSIEKFFDTLNDEEKLLLSAYLKKRTYVSLSEAYDEILRPADETQKTDS